MGFYGRVSLWKKKILMNGIGQRLIFKKLQATSQK